MNTAYWVKEFILVIIAYAGVTFLWPSIVFRKYLDKKSLTMKISFCVLFMWAATNLVVLTLGLCHILNVWVVRVVFYGIPVAGILIPFIRKKGDDVIRRTAAVLNGGYGRRTLTSDARMTGRAVIISATKGIADRVKGHLIQYVLLGIVVLYGVIYFSAGALANHSYGFSDLYVHAEWTARLLEGKIFYAGIYPEGMHTYIYLMHVVTGISIQSLLMYFGPVHLSMLFVSIYLLTKELFQWRYTGILAMTLFLTIEAAVAQNIYSLSRLQCSLPEEVGMFAAFLCPVFLLRFLKDGKSKAELERNIFKRIIKDENLVLFMLSIAVTIEAHFYCTFIAAFLCIAIVPFYAKKLFTDGRFLTLLLTSVMALVLAAAPMLGAFAEGKQFQGSIGWGLRVITGSQGGGSGSSTGKPGGSTYPLPTGTPGGDVTEPGQSGFAYTMQQLFNKTYGTVFGKSQTNFFFYAFLAALGACLALLLVAIIVNSRRKKAGKEKIDFNLKNYFSLILMATVLMVMYDPRPIGLPTLMESSRIGYVEMILQAAVLFLLVDIAMGLLNRLLQDTGDGIIALVATAGVAVCVVATGHYHGGLYYTIYRYNAATSTAEKIMAEYEDETYTIVSPVEELWQLYGKGRHEEIIRFVNSTDKESYTLPTDNIFIFIEKHTLVTGQIHYCYMPKWLAVDGKSRKTYVYLLSSEHGKLLKLTTDEVEKQELPEKSSTYQNMAKRHYLEYRAAKWVESFEELYPYALSVYYEDEDFVCYRIEQNSKVKYELALQYTEDETENEEND